MFIIKISFVEYFSDVLSVFCFTGSWGGDCPLSLILTEGSDSPAAVTKAGANCKNNHSSMSNKTAKYGLPDPRESK